MGIHAHQTHQIHYAEILGGAHRTRVVEFNEAIGQVGAVGETTNRH